MKSFFILSLLLVLILPTTSRMAIRLEKSLNSNEQAYKIVCAGGVPPYTYKIKGLPSGAFLKNDIISLGNSTKPGSYILNIGATDSTGQTALKNVNLGVESYVREQSSNTGNQETSNPESSLDSLFSANNIVNSNTGNRTQSNSRASQVSSSTNGISSSIDPSSSLAQIFNRYGIKPIAPKDYKIQSTQFIDSNQYLKDIISNINSKSTTSQPSTNLNVPLTPSEPSQITFSAENTASTSNQQTTNSEIQNPSNSNVNQEFNQNQNFNSNQDLNLNQASFTQSNQFRYINPSTPLNVPTPSTPSALSGQSAPSGPSGPSGSSNNDGRLSNLISTYAVDPIKSGSYPGNKYPSIDFPTSPTPGQFNPTLSLIQNYNAVPGQDNRNTITPDDITLRAASQRHQNAIKAITNLAKIADQARANKDMAQNLIDKLTDEFNRAVQNQRNAQQDITQVEQKISQASSAITNINSQLNVLQNQMGDTKRQRDSLISQRTQLQSQLNSLTQKRNTVYDQYNTATATIKGYQTAVNNRKSACSALSTQASNYRTELNNASEQSLTAETKILDLTSQLRAKQQLIDELQKQLSRAVSDRDSIQKDLESTKGLKQRLPAKIEQLTQNVKSTQTSLNQCEGDIKNLRDSIKQLQDKADKQKTEVSDIQSKLTDSNNKINSLSSTISSLDKNGPDQTARITELQNNIKTLRQQQLDLATQRNTKQANGNDANNKVVFARQNLNAAVERFNTEQATIKSATLNLEKARSEQALARAALQQLMTKYADVLPYAIVPNGGGKTNPGYPAGNNPSGSPLGAIATNGNGAPGSYPINSWTNYLSQAFGAGVNPAIIGSITNLFPFSFSSTVQGNLVTNTGYGNIRSVTGSASKISGCGGNGRTQSVTGRVSLVRNDSFDLRTDNGQFYSVSISPCTSLVANKNRYVINKGDYAVVKGIEQSRGRLNGQNVLCLA